MGAPASVGKRACEADWGASVRDKDTDIKYPPVCGDVCDWRKREYCRDVVSVSGSL